MLAPTHVKLSGERFRVIYNLTGDETEAKAKAEDICIEQTVEFPVDLIPEDDIRHHVFGRIESWQSSAQDQHQATISYAVELSGFQLPQLLNVIFGNTSIKPGIRVEQLELPDSLLNSFKGPRFGRTGWRNLLNIPKRPLFCTALKPMGFSPDALADMAYRFALGGIDIIKDDHGLANQPFSPYRERVERCVEAVARANQETGYNCIYAPSLNLPAERLLDEALFAKQVGAEALMLAPGLVGWDAMRQLADDDRLALPIISHPALQGSFVTSPHQGISHYALFGQIARLAGADATIYPNWGGRFAFSKADCASIVAGSTVSMGQIKPIFPAPGGGMSLERIPEMLELYGSEVIFLIGGGLHQRGPDLVENCRHFRQLCTS